MDGTLAEVIVTAIFFCWIPILALGKAIAWIVEAAKSNYDKNDENNKCPHGDNYDDCPDCRH